MGWANTSFNNSVLRAILVDICTQRCVLKTTGRETVGQAEGLDSRKEGNQYQNGCPSAVLARSADLSALRVRASVRTG